MSTSTQNSRAARLAGARLGHSGSRLEKHPSNPILRPEPANAWESLVTCNPGVWLDDDGTFQMLYRAAGDDEDHVIRFGLATSKDGVHFSRTGSEPILSPSIDGPDAGCIEDPRIVRLDGHYYITYAYRAHFPGQYWKQADNSAFNPRDASLPPLFGENLTASGLLVSDDLRTYRRLGRITRPDVDDRDVILFPARVGGRYAMLHRPMQWVGEPHGTQYPGIWISLSDSLLSWPESRLLARNEFAWERKLGGATPPLWTEDGWFTLYHAVDEKGVYRVGAMLLDLESPWVVTARTREPIMEPEHDYEWRGLYPHGVVFPTANVVKDGVIYIYYGCSDQTIGVATADFAALVESVREQPWQ
ncbi:MAG: glycosidase [Planctomycetota bacterium]